MSNSNNYNNNNNDEFPLVLQKATPTKIASQITRDTIEPPISEEAYMETSVEENSELSPTRSMKQLGGGLFEQLLQRGRVA